MSCPVLPPGGINAVFLAKALANDQKMDQLREMWVREGDIAKLLNDKESDKELGLGQQTPPRSLLNSRRMYYKLLDSLYEMDRQSSERDAKSAAQANDEDPHPPAQPYADET